MANSGKVSGLEKLMLHTDLGYIVPDFKVIGIEQYDWIEKQSIITEIVSNLTRTPHVASKLPPEFANIIAELREFCLGKPVIVRSSSLHEDTQHSFAGIYDSFYVEHPTPSDLAQAVFQVYASMNSDRAQQYRAEHHILDDRMEVIVQRFVEPKWSGVMYTSNPTFPDDLCIEIVKGRNTIVKGTKEAYIIEYNKKTLKTVFEGEKKPHALFDTKKLAHLGIALEQRIGPSDIEFVVAHGNFYLVQARQITDLEYPSEVAIPKYKPSQFLGKTSVKRGSGKVTLPVVAVPDMDDLIQKLDIARRLDPQTYVNEIRKFFENIKRLDALYSSGYLLLTPHFYDTCVPITAGVVGLSPETTINNLTPHKSAIITFRFASVSSHAMTVAREKGIAYAGFEGGQENLEDVQTGDILSVYFVGRNALVYQEEVAPRSIRETHPEVSYEVKRANGKLYIQSSCWLDSPKPYIQDLELFLHTTTGKTWKFENWGEQLGGDFINEDGQVISMQMAKMRGQYHMWNFLSPTEVRNFRQKEPLSDNQFKDIQDKYEQHLTGK